MLQASRGDFSRVLRELPDRQHGADSIENTSSAQMKQFGARLLSSIGIASVGVIESSEPEAPCELAVAETFFSRKPKAPLVKHDG